MSLFNAQEKTHIVNRLGRMAVLYGGVSAERDISLASGQAVLNALRNNGVDTVGVDIGPDALHQLQQVTADTVFIALHGSGGEDGTVQALLDYLRLPYTGSGVLASALTMDKLRTKHLWRGVGLSTPDYRLLNDISDWAAVHAALGPRVFVKPVHEGSSLGMAVAGSADELQAAYRNAAGYDRAVLAEHCIEGAEYTVAVLNGQTLPPIKLETDHAFYDYEAKYVANDTRYICPCGLAADKERELRELALRAFEVVGGSGWGRADVMADRDGNFYLLEINTIPGMTDHSLVPMAAKAAGYSFDDLVLAIASQSLQRVTGA